MCKCSAQTSPKAQRLAHPFIARRTAGIEACDAMFFAPGLRCLCQLLRDTFLTENRLDVEVLEYRGI